MAESKAAGMEFILTVQHNPEGRSLFSFHNKKDDGEVKYRILAEAVLLFFLLIQNCVKHHQVAYKK